MKIWRKGNLIKLMIHLLQIPVPLLGNHENNGRKPLKFHITFQNSIAGCSLRKKLQYHTE